MRTRWLLLIFAGSVCALAGFGAIAYSAGWQAAVASGALPAAFVSVPDTPRPDAPMRRSPFQQQLPAQPALPSPPVPLPMAPPIQELVPLPGPGDQFPGQQQQPQPGQRQDEQCEPRLYLFHNGRFYEMRPGPDGGPGGPQELIPLRPVPGIPGMPAPGTPLRPGLPSPPPGQRF
jgi:predicted membrane metal-binding protein